ncbi:Phosphoglucomutase, first 3 domain-containing protein [Pholiota conissans]|uniref:Phosphoglucomutase, first 3 domain-containing protein n=1 Tax=Pholiota conissans TaxID=109636 RepID=A0A9P5YT49_9AGAR|nr:Phosphoglucomutase, first 3 domain-containing protein [Pholiota conissans]
MSLRDLVDQWLILDPNPETRHEIQSLWDRKEYDELDKRLRTRIEFGTAGLRGRMEAGWSRMNDLIIIQTSQGLAEYVLKHVTNAKMRGLVVGHDHRHHSEHWADLTAKIFVAKGFRVYPLQGLNHTPMVPFGVKKLNAACGVMITASHNPKQDNGYKVYWENAVQIISPHDEGIALSIQADLQPQPSELDANISSSLTVDLTEELRNDYFDYLKTLSSTDALNRQLSVKFVNTSLHGVGDPFVKRAFELYGFPPYIPVKEQQQPDPEFSTVKFPNPEEKGALDLALKTANTIGADYVLAQDPDSDRFTAAEKRPNGEWILYTGDQLGSLFASQVLQAYKSSGKPVNKLAIVASTVSSKMIEEMAKIEGFKFAECLTGFKFIGNTGLNLVDDGYDVPFGYEEAIGFMFGTQIRDKDGVAATVMFAELVASLRAQGKTIYDHLQELYKRYGYFETSNSYFVSTDPKITDEIFAHIRQRDPTDDLSTYPKTLGGLNINRIIDLTTGYDSGNPPDFTPSLPLSSGHMIQVRAGDPIEKVKLVLTLRTSGTEPKIKYYLEGNGSNPQTVNSLLSRAIEDISNNWIQSSKYSLPRA